MRTPTLPTRSAFLLAWGVCVGTGAWADPADPLVFGGFSGSTDNKYVYLGSVMPFEGAQLGHGAFQRITGAWLNYKYNADIGGGPTRVDVGAASLDYSIGYATSDDTYALEASVGLGVRRTRSHPRDPASAADGTELMLTPQVQGRVNFSPSFDADGIAAHSFGPNSSFLKARFGYVPANRWRVGPQAVYSRGENYRSTGVGLFLAHSFDSKLSLNVSVGRARDQDARRSTFMGLEFAFPI